ncbi:MAG: polymer-forming cytoskeletal protein [Deltaproteobacteria bacterium]|nr:polymer-forming cytoskeletal protein [Candidatus Zymogenaceae bacterium]
MGFFDKKIDEEPKVEPVYTPKSSNDDIRPRRDCECYIASGVTVEGKITGSASVGIDGDFDGQLDISSTLMIGEAGTFQGEIKAKDVVISGTVKGNIAAENLLEVHPTGKIHGDIYANRLVIADGVIFEGNITMSREQSPEPYSPPEPTPDEEEPEEDLGPISNY